MSDMMQPGTYHGQLIGIEARQLDNANKTPLIELKFKVMYLWNGTAWTDLASVGKGCNRHVQLWMTEKGRDRSMEHLLPLGFNGKFRDPRVSKMNECMNLVCTHDTYQGKIKEQWNLSGGAGGGAELDQTVADELEAVWQTKMALAQPPQGTPAPPPAMASAPQGPAMNVPSTTEPQPPALDPDPEGEIPF